MRLIDGDALIMELKNEVCDTDTSQRADGIRDAIVSVMMAPTVHIEGTAKWKRLVSHCATTGANDFETTTVTYQCTGCGSLSASPYYYCPGCGRWMRFSTE